MLKKSWTSWGIVGSVLEASKAHFGSEATLTGVGGGERSSPVLKQYLYYFIRTIFV